MSSFDLKKIVRPRMYNLQFHHCAEDNFEGDVAQDGSENAASPTVEGLDKPTDPQQLELKAVLANYRNKTSVFKDLEPLTADNVCLGVGSDEGIDTVIRATCVPGKEKILINPPTYPMYSVCANINDVEVVECPLLIKDISFQIDIEKILSILGGDPLIKLCFITSPGNPTGQKVDTHRLIKLLENWKNGLVVVDEAYIDFCGGSVAPLVTKYPNLVVLHTLSKSFGLAGIRLGATFCSVEFSRVLNAMKAPYSISRVTSEFALRAVENHNLELIEQNAKKINEEKYRLLKTLTSFPLVDKYQLGGLDANFILLRIRGGDNELARRIYYHLATISGVVVRFRGDELGCKGCLKITVGTREENDKLITEFKRAVDDFMQ